jgi:hypothetical protein
MSAHARHFMTYQGMGNYFGGMSAGWGWCTGWGGGRAPGRAGVRWGYGRLLRRVHDRAGARQRGRCTSWHWVRDLEWNIGAAWKLGRHFRTLSFRAAPNFRAICRCPAPGRVRLGLPGGRARGGPGRTVIGTAWWAWAENHCRYDKNGFKGFKCAKYAIRHAHDVSNASLPGCGSRQGWVRCCRRAGGRCGLVRGTRRGRWLLARRRAQAGLRRAATGLIGGHRRRRAW